MGDNIKKQEKLKEEIKELIDKGAELGAYLNFDEQTKSCPQLANFIGQYEIWYTKSLMIMKRLSPERTQDFALLYDNPKRKEVNLSTYCISDALRGISELLGKYGPWTAMLCVIRQTAMLQACLDNLDSTVLNIQTILQADIFDSEIESAKHLLKNGFLRAAGVVCGVVIEKHFSEVCKNNSISISKKNPTIADYNDALKENVYDILEWRRIQRLGDIRNLCGHNKEREPTKEEVFELISGTERIIKTIF